MYGCRIGGTAGSATRFRGDNAALLGAVPHAEKLADLREPDVSGECVKIVFKAFKTR